jgi:4'-phosphopantetheinyl transferase EntD
MLPPPDPKSFLSAISPESFALGHFELGQFDVRKKSVWDQVQEASTEVRLALPLPACASTHLRKFSDVVDANSSPVENRNREFAVGRYCATRSLQRLGITAEVPVDTDRKPVWPDGIVGSISHSHHYAWAATAQKESIKGIGVDTEIVVDDSTLRQIVKEITNEQEQKLLSLIHPDIRVAFTVVFSAKESIFKCLYPLNEKFFGFHDVELIAANGQQVTFSQQPTSPNFLTAPRNLTVQYSVFADDVFTTIWI